MPTHADFNCSLKIKAACIIKSLLLELTAIILFVRTNTHKFNYALDLFVSSVHFRPHAFNSSPLRFFRLRVRRSAEKVRAKRREKTRRRRNGGKRNRQTGFLATIRHGKKRRLRRSRNGSTTASKVRQHLHCLRPSLPTGLKHLADLKCNSATR